MPVELCRIQCQQVLDRLDQHDTPDWCGNEKARRLCRLFIMFVVSPVIVPVVVVPLCLFPAGVFGGFRRDM